MSDLVYRAPDADGLARSEAELRARDALAVQVAAGQAVRYGACGMPKTVGVLAPVRRTMHRIGIGVAAVVWSEILMWLGHSDMREVLFVAATGLASYVLIRGGARIRTARARAWSERLPFPFQWNDVLLLKRPPEAIIVRAEPADDDAARVADDLVWR